MLIIALAYLALAYGRSYLAMARQSEFFLRRADAVNPLESTFEKRRINIQDFFNPFGAFHENKTFIDCELIGPAVIYLEDSNMTIREFGCDYVVINKENKPDTAIFFKNATIKHCKLFNLTILISENGIERLGDLAERLHWISNFPSEKVVKEPGDGKE